MGIKEDYQKAVKLAQQNKFIKARSLLIAYDHPKTNALLEKINRAILADRSRVKDKKRLSPIGCLLRVIGLVIVAFCGLVALVAIFGPPTEELRARASETAEIRQSAASETAEIRQFAASETAVISLMLTQTAAAIPTSTITPTPVVTHTPVDTPTMIPSMTPAQTGTRSNPYAAGSIQEIRDGRIRVNSILYNQTNAVEQMNMFNADPDPGEEWVIVNITFSCDVSPDDTCVTTLMSFNLVGDSGEVYTREIFGVIDNAFEGEVFGGGTKTGNIGFIVDSSDTNLLFAVNEFGNRTFFELP